MRSSSISWISIHFDGSSSSISWIIVHCNVTTIYILLFSVIIISTEMTRVIINVTTTPIATAAPVESSSSDSSTAVVKIYD